MSLRRAIGYGVGLVVVVALAVTVFGLVQYYWPHRYGTVTVTIPRASTADDAADILARAGVIQSVMAFKAAVRIEGVGAKLQPGRYRFRQGTSYSDIIARLVKGPPKPTSFKLVVPEGFTIEEIARRLSFATPVDGAEFQQLATTGASDFAPDYPFLKGDPLPTLEGYLFPKTYLVTTKTTSNQLVSQMLGQFEREAAPLRWQLAKARGLSLHQILVVASMIEKEARVPKERRLVAAVIYNRLAKGMRLQNDATVQYALGQRRARLTAQDLNVQSPYNTYLNAGLPPGPICNPGLAAIKAALRPAKVGYLYYVLKNRHGQHFFTSSYDAFLAAKARYRRSLGP